MVSMTVLKYHTLSGVEHCEGDTYEVAEDQVANLTGQGLAAVTTPDAKTATPSPPQTPEPATASVSPTAVAPMILEPQAPLKKAAPRTKVLAKAKPRSKGRK